MAIVVSFLGYAIKITFYMVVIAACIKYLKS